MKGWKVSRPSDVATLNDSVFRAVARKFALLFVLMVPSQIGLTLLAAHERFPTMSAAHTLAVAVPFFLVGFGTHYGLVFVGLIFITAVYSLVKYRELLAVGRPSPVLAALAFAMRQVVRRPAGQLDADLLTLPARRERASRTRPEPTLLDQLCASLCLASAAPPLRLTCIANRPVRPDQFIQQRIA